MGALLFMKQNDYLCAKKLIRTCVSIAQLAEKRDLVNASCHDFRKTSLLSAENHHKRQTSRSAAVFRGKEGISSLPQTCLHSCITTKLLAQLYIYMRRRCGHLYLEEAVELPSLENAYQKVSLSSLRRWRPASQVFTLQ